MTKHPQEIIRDSISTTLAQYGVKMAQDELEHIAATACIKLSREGALAGLPPVVNPLLEANRHARKDLSLLLSVRGNKAPA